MKKLLNLQIPEHSYLIGFIQTDGHLQKNKGNKGKLTIEISQKDNDILEKLQNIIPVKTSIYKRIRETNFCKSYSSITLNVFNLEFRKEIESCGVSYGKKSSIIHPPTQKYLENDYWRGIIDGDGSLGFTKNNIPFISLVTKSQKLYEYYRLFLEKHNIEVNVSPNKRDSCYNIILFNEKAQKIINVLYYDNCLSLNRKQQKATEILNWKRPLEIKKREKENKKWSQYEIEILKKEDLQTCIKKIKNRTLNAIKIKKNRIK